MFSAFEILLIVGASQCLMLVMGLNGAKQRKVSANRYLLIFSVIVSLQLIDSALEFSEVYRLYPEAIYLTSPTLFILGPAIWLYVVGLIQPKVDNLLIHFLPALICLLCALPIYILDAESKILMFYTNEYEINELREWIIVPFFLMLLLAPIHFFVYLLLSLKKLNQHARTAKQFFSNAQDTQLSWLKRLVKAYLVIAVIFAFGTYFSSVFSKQLEEAVYFVLHAVLVCVTAWMLYRSMLQPEIHYTKQMLEQLNPTKEQEAKKYNNSSLSRDLSTQMLEDLRAHMETQKPFLDGDLSLSTLAQQMQLSSHHLSQVINESAGQSFFEFVNEYRVTEAARLLRETDHPIIQIAFDAGFNSKSSFYNCFKKSTQQTPSAYRNSE